MNYSIYIYQGGGTEEGEWKNIHTYLEWPFLCFFFYTQSLLKELFGIQKSTLLAELTLITDFLELEHRRN